MVLTDFLLPTSPSLRIESHASIHMSLQPPFFNISSAAGVVISVEVSLSTDDLFCY